MFALSTIYKQRLSLAILSFGPISIPLKKHPTSINSHKKILNRCPRQDIQSSPTPLPVAFGRNQDPLKILSPKKPKEPAATVAPLAADAKEYSTCVRVMDVRERVDSVPVLRRRGGKTEGRGGGESGRTWPPPLSKALALCHVAPHNEAARWASVITAPWLVFCLPWNGLLCREPRSAPLFSHHWSPSRDYSFSAPSTSAIHSHRHSLAAAYQPRRTKEHVKLKDFSWYAFNEYANVATCPTSFSHPFHPASVQGEVGFALSFTERYCEPAVATKQPGPAGPRILRDFHVRNKERSIDQVSLRVPGFRRSHQRGQYGQPIRWQLPLLLATD
ncbi:hypothetical protein WN48_07377 [Eufriesea mexicana]|uniref:Uncharacterized protein n=1 Tax=Eufriesea mexicana TaxID=516756 RepID=A0A310SUJ1_9HYME|nr:hypothetical protein WN48_07377 [Eufriesea mexicana]